MKKTLLLLIALVTMSNNLAAATSTILPLDGGWSYTLTGAVTADYGPWNPLNVTAGLTEGFDVSNYKSITLNYTKVDGSFRFYTVGKKAQGTEPETYDENSALQYKDLSTTSTPGSVTITFNENSYSEYEGNLYDGGNNKKVKCVYLTYWSGSGTGSIDITSVVLTDNNDVQTTMSYKKPWSGVQIVSCGEVNYAQYGEMGKTQWKATKEDNTIHRFTVNFGTALAAGNDLRFRIYIPDGEDDDDADDEKWQSISNGSTSATLYIDYAYNDISLYSNNATSINVSSVTRTIYSITSLWSDTHTIGSTWGNFTSLATSNKKDLASAKIGDIIRITCDNVSSSNALWICNGHTYDVFNNEAKAALAVQEDAQSFYYTLTALDVERIHESGIVISGQNFTLKKVELLTNEGNETLNYSPITITSAGVATYNSSQKLDFTAKSLKAYVASSIDAVNNTVTMTRVYKVPASTGLYLIGEEGDYEIPYLDGDADDIGTNFLVATNLWQSKVYESMENEYRYILASKSGVVGLFKVTSSGLSNTESQTGTYYEKKYHTLGAHKAYLQTTTDITPTQAPALLFFNDSETTGINTVKDSEFKVNDNVYYDLSGRRVAQPTKGLYIVNGKKVVIK